MKRCSVPWNQLKRFIKIVNDELTALLGGTQSRIMISSNNNYYARWFCKGAGKTTTADEIAV